MVRYIKSSSILKDLSTFRNRLWDLAETDMYSVFAELIAYISEDDAYDIWKTLTGLTKEDLEAEEEEV